MPGILHERCMLSHFSCVQLCVTLGTVACQDPLSMGSSRQEYWTGLLFPAPGDFPNPGIKLTSPNTHYYFDIQNKPMMAVKIILHFINQ